jgi:hypothetical protein
MLRFWTFVAPDGRGEMATESDYEQPGKRGSGRPGAREQHRVGARQRCQLVCGSPVERCTPPRPWVCVRRSAHLPPTETLPPTLCRCVPVHLQAVSSRERDNSCVQRGDALNCVHRETERRAERSDSQHFHPLAGWAIAGRTTTTRRTFGWCTMTATTLRWVTGRCFSTRRKPSLALLARDVALAQNVSRGSVWIHVGVRGWGGVRSDRCRSRREQCK